MTYGFLVGEIIRRVTGELPGPWVAGHVAGPLGAACYLGLPASLRGTPAPLLPFPERPGGQASTHRADPGSLPYRASFGFTDPPMGPLAVNDPEIQAAQLPAVNGIGNARGLARIFAALIGEVDGVRLLSPAAMEAEARAGARSRPCRVRHDQHRARHRLQPPDAGTAARRAWLVRDGGLGGCRVWALPEAGLAYAYLPLQPLDANPDPRDAALTATTLASL